MFAQLKLGANGFSYQGRWYYLADYEVQRLQYLQSLAAIQKPIKIIRQQHYLQVACNDDGRIALSRRPACMSLYLANGYLLMTEDVLGFAASS